MGNYFSNAFKSITGDRGSFIPDDAKLNGSIFYTIGNFFGYDLGARGLARYLKAYASNALVYMIVNRIATTTAAIDRIYQDDNNELIESGSEIEELMDSPNEGQGRIEFYEMAYEFLLTTGNLFIRFIEGVGMGEELQILNSARMRLVLNNAGLPDHWLFTNNIGNDVRIELEDMLHIKTSNIVEVSNTGVFFGLSPLEAAWAIVKASDEIFSAEASIFKNRGIIGILTNESDVPMLKGERERLQKEFDEEVGGSDKFNKLKISNTKLKYIQTGMSPTDLKLLEGILSKLRLLAAVYGMPSVLFNDTASSTFNNVQEAEKGAFNNVYIPLGNKVDRELSKFLSEKLDVEENIVIDKTSIEVIKGTTNPVGQALNNLPTQVAVRLASSITRNEAREIIELPALEGDEGEELIGDGKLPTEIEVTQV